MSLANRLSSAWSAFMGRDSPFTALSVAPRTSSQNPSRQLMTNYRDRSLINAIYNRIALDAASVPIKHVKVDDEDRYMNDVSKSDLNLLLNVSANIDQTGRSFRLDAFYSLLQEGYVAIIPTDTDKNPNTNDDFTIYNLRVGKIIQWEPRRVQVEVYNEKVGNQQQIWMGKQAVAIIENPFFSVMNDVNSTLKRLLNKMALLDKIDSESAMGKLDLIIQLPYVVKSAARKEQAQSRRKEIIDQLTGSELGIAYTDGTEKITQLNRSLENNLPKQIEDLTKQLYDQLFITPEILNGTASTEIMTNYRARVIAPILYAFCEELSRKFLTKTARTQGQTIMFFQNYFELVPIDKMADLADKLTRNAIVTSNEMRQFLHMVPSQDPDADALRNKNMPMEQQPMGAIEAGTYADEEVANSGETENLFNPF